jgi:hypothetical protein
MYNNPFFLPVIIWAEWMQMNSPRDEDDDFYGIMTYLEEKGKNPWDGRQ